MTKPDAKLLLKLQRIKIKLLEKALENAQELGRLRAEYRSLN